MPTTFTYTTATNSSITFTAAYNFVWDSETTSTYITLDGTSTSNTSWYSYNDAKITWTWTTSQAYEPTAEELAERKRRQEQYEREYKERKRKEKEARRKAFETMAMFLTEEELEMYEKYKHILVDGEEYSYIIPREGMIIRLKRDGQMFKLVDRLCIHPEKSVPVYDTILSFVLMIKGGCEKQLLEIANSHMLGDLDRNRYRGLDHLQRVA